MNKKYYITTPIYYVNALPHLGNAYSTFAANVLADYHRMLGEDVYFVTGTDENAQKNVEAAESAGEDVKKYVDRMSARWQETWDTLAVTNNDFIRTTEERHKKGVEKFYNTVFAKSDIYKGTYEGLYCIGCESYKTDGDLVDGLCPEDNYFFKVTKYREKLLKHIEDNPNFIQPKERRNEIIRYIADYMEDFSISRVNQKWGIPAPNDNEHTLYVWFDALINYLTAVGYGTDEKMFKKWWPAQMHIVGKDILKHHAAWWPAMLMAADLPLPERIFAHGFFTVNGEKMSKTIGNVLNPEYLAKQLGIEPLKYYLLHDIPFGKDGDVSIDKFQEIYTSELANGIGNLISRVTSMIEKYSNGVIPSPNKMINRFPAPTLINKHLESASFEKALKEIQKAVSDINTKINEEKPWEMAKEKKTEELDSFLYDAVEVIRNIAWALIPFMPETSDKIFESLGLIAAEEKKQTFVKISEKTTIEPGLKVKKPPILFPTISP